jgi:hypothetical protein
MKGAAAPPPESRLRHRSSSSSRRSATRSPSISPNQQNRLESLGFEEGELEMFFDMTNISEDQLVQRYLDIAQNQPYNLNWGSERVAINADYMLGVYKRNGIEYTKHDIVEDTLSSFYDEAQGLGQGIRKKKRGTRKYGRKHRSHKKRHTRRHRTRHRRRYN